MILTRYIVIQVIQFVCVALILLVGMDSVFAFIAELEDVTDSYGAYDAGLYIMATIPRRFYEFIPVSVLIGALFALGQMAQNSELIVMRASSFSIAQIIKAGLIAALFFSMMALILAQWLLPPVEQFAQSYRALQQGGGDVLRMKQGNWQKDGNTLVHITAIAPDDTIFGISRFVFDQDKQLTQVSFSDRAHYQGQHKGQTKGWLLINTRSTQFGLNQTQTEFVENSFWNTALTPDMMAMIIMEPDYLSITELHQYARFLEAQGLSFQSFSLSFWKKLVQPIVSLLMVIIALSFIFGPLRSSTMGFRITIGLVVGMLFYYAQDFLGYSSLVFNLPPFWAAVFPLVPFSFLAWYLLIRRQ